MKEESVSNLRIFEKNGSKYLADVDTGFVVKIDESCLFLTLWLFLSEGNILQWKF